MNQLLRAAVAGLLGLSVASIGGCGPSAQDTPKPTAANGNAQDHDHDHDHEHDHDHDHDHDDATSQSLAEAVGEVERLRAEIEQSLAAGDLDAADGPVHKIGDVLETIPGLAEKQQLDAAALATVNKAVDELFDCFGAIDERIHHGEPAGRTYADVSDQVRAALATLQGVVSGTE